MSEMFSVVRKEDMVLARLASFKCDCLGRTWSPRQGGLVVVNFCSQKMLVEVSIHLRKGALCGQLRIQVFPKASTQALAVILSTNAQTVAL